MKAILTFLSVIIILLVMLPIVVGMLLQVGFIQNYAVSRIAMVLSQKTQTVVSISHVDLEFFTNAVLDDVYIQDYAGDTMIYVKRLKAGVAGINFFQGGINLSTVTLRQGKVRLAKDSLGETNFKQFFDKLSGTKDSTVVKSDFRMTVQELNLIDFRFQLDDSLSQKQDYGINFKNLDVFNINFQARQVSVLNDDIRLSLAHLSLREKSGFVLDHLSSPQCGVGSTGMRFEKIRLETSRSTLNLGHLYFLYDRWTAWQDFVQKVTMDVDIKPSNLAWSTLSYFIRKPTTIRSMLELEGEVRGAVPSIEGFLKNVRCQDTELDLEFRIAGLPNVDSTRFELRLNNLSTTALDVTSIYADVTGGSSLSSIAPILSRSGTINLVGDFDGLISDFQTNATLYTKQGSLDAKLRVLTSAARDVNFIGSLATDSYNIGQALAVRKMGRVSLDAKVDIITSPISGLRLTTSASINRFEWGRYAFNRIEMDGQFQGRSFQGSVSSKDPNLEFSALGHLSLQGDEPVYDFSMDLNRANLRALYVNPRDSVSVVAAKFRAKARGSNIDNINGEANIDNILYINHIDTVKADEIRITAQNTDIFKQIVLSSEFADIELQGRNSFSQIFRYLSQTAQKYLPSIPDATQIVTRKDQAITTTAKQEKPYSDGYYMLRMDVKKANNVAAIFLPGLEISQGTNLYFFFNPYLDQFNITLKSGLINRQNLAVKGLDIESRNYPDSLSYRLKTERLAVGNMDFDRFAMRGGIKNNRITLDASFDNGDKGSRAVFATTTSIYRTDLGLPQIRVDMLPTCIEINHKPWNVELGGVVFDTTGIAIDRFKVENLAQVAYLDGKIGRSAKDTISIEFRDFDISPATALIGNLGYSLAGTVSGHAQGVQLFRTTQFNAELQFRDILLNNYPLGDPTFSSFWNSRQKRIELRLNDQDHNTPINGYYDVNNRRAEVDIKFPKFDLVLLEPLLKGILSNTSGQGDVALRLTLKDGKPYINGKVDVKKYSALVDYTKARYDLNGEISVINNRFELPESPLTDNLQGTGTIQAWFDSKFFKDLRFGVTARFTNLLALNTTIKDNTSFYGRAFGTGQFSINGNERQTNMNIVAQTALASEFILPMTNVSTISKANFITFVDPKKEEEQKTETEPKKVKVANEMDIKIDLHVLPNTQAQISIVTENMGNLVKGRGDGRFAIHINPTQDIFTMTGPFEIEKGSYQFNFRTIFDKWFTIEPGGRLIWTGDPANPDVNFSAIYKVKTSLDPITGGLGGSSSANVDCGITLTNTLLNPQPRFTITAPQANPETQNMLRNYLNTEDIVQMQFFSLFLAGIFTPDLGASAISSVGTSLASATGFEFLSNQLSNIISTDRFMIKPTFRPRSETSSDEFGLRVEGELINNKLSIELSGNYSTMNNPTYNQRTPFTGDAYVTYVLNKTATLKLKGFTRVIDRFDETQGLQESGVGVYYRQDFQTLAELKAKYDAWRKNIKTRRAAGKK